MIAAAVGRRRILKIRFPVPLVWSIAAVVEEVVLLPAASRQCDVCRARQGSRCVGRRLDALRRQSDGRIRIRACGRSPATAGAETADWYRSAGGL